MVAIKQYLPKGLYIDPYELTSLQQHNLTEIIVTSENTQYIDVEAPEYLATEIDLFIYMKSDSQCAHCFRAMLPVHCRYHRPAENDGKTSGVLKSPEILIHCQKRGCWKQSEIEAPCSQRNGHTCRWNNVKYKFVNEKVIVHIPVGLKEHSSLVCVMTLLATALCSSLVLAAVCKHGHFSLAQCS
uniref:Phosphatidylinositol-glycan biosynthesis class X protein n=1 Tax=Sphenodon punctatus TaxID=8508 RepID=A0A8D0HAG4_SPHPU